jgi:hypothetical protein
MLAPVLSHHVRDGFARGVDRPGFSAKSLPECRSIQTFLLPNHGATDHQFRLTAFRIEPRERDSGRGGNRFLPFSARPGRRDRTGPPPGMQRKDPVLAAPCY